MFIPLLSFFIGGILSMIQKSRIPFLLYLLIFIALVFYNPSYKYAAVDLSKLSRVSIQYPWASTFYNTKSTIFMPEDYSQLAYYLLNNTKPIRVAGAMHSINPLVLSDTIVDLQEMQKILWFNGTHVRAHAAVRIYAMQNFLNDRGKTLRGIGHITHQTLAGAFSTSLSGVELVAFSRFVTGALVMNAMGEHHEWRDLYFLKDSMGLMGIILELEFEVFDNVMLKLSKQKRELTTCLQSDFVDSAYGFVSFMDGASNFKDVLTYSWVPETLKIAYSSSPTPSNAWLGEFVDWVWTPITFILPYRYFTGVWNHQNLDDTQYLSNIGTGVTSYGGTWFLEYRIPIEKCFEFLKDIQDPDALLQVKLLRGRTDSCFSHTQSTCKVDFFIKGFSDFRSHEDRAIEFGGYSHFGKYFKGNFTRNFANFPCYSDFEKLRMKQDPNGRFKNDFLNGYAFDYWDGSSRVWIFYVLFLSFIILHTFWVCSCCKPDYSRFLNVNFKYKKVSENKSHYKILQDKH